MATYNKTKKASGAICWVLTHEWTEDFDHGLNVEVYATLGEAKKKLKILVAEVKDWQDYDEEEEDDMRYEGWNTGEYNNYHTSIAVKLKIIK